MLKIHKSGLVTTITFENGWTVSSTMVGRETENGTWNTTWSWEVAVYLPDSTVGRYFYNVDAALYREILNNAAMETLKI